MAQITINGVSIRSGQNITIRNNRVIVDGEDVTPDAKEISIAVTGDVERLEASGCTSVEVSGNAGSISSKAGDVQVGGDVAGGIHSKAGNVDIDGSVGGDVSVTAGNIRYRK